MVMTVKDVLVELIEEDSVAGAHDMISTATDQAFEFADSFIVFIEAEFVLHFHEFLEVAFVAAAAENLHESRTIYTN